MQNINIAADGGGTGLRIIAFGDDLKLVSRSGSGPVNPNFESIGKITDNMAEAAKILAADLGGGCKITNIYAAIVGPAGLFCEIFKRELGECALGAAFHTISEARSHILAASLGDTGGVALAGTGSGAIYCSRGDVIHIGGYGVPVGDEGSGAWIGIQGMAAAIRYISGWGEKTALAGRLCEYLKVTPDSITGALYKKDVSQRDLFAGFCPCVAECERAGDAAAREIIHSAGKNMGLQMAAALKKAGIGAGEAPVIYASGGAWKGTPYMMEAMRETICGAYPGAVCRHGMFDPVMAGVIRHIFDKTGEHTVPKRDEMRLKKEFRDYEVKIS